MDSRLIPEVNIGTLGHVDHGKSTLVEALTGKWTALHSEELKRGITIKLGYADATIYKCVKCNILCESEKCPQCFEICEPQRTISFVDAPGHETLMATVLSGTSLMDGILFVIAANEKCPQPQTREHLMVLNIVGIKNIIIVQTKIDLVSREEALENYRQIKEFIKGTVAENAPIIPVSSQKKINLDSVLEAIQNYIPTPKREISRPPKMLIARSFDINKPGTEIEKLKGGVIGGSLIFGEFKIGDEIEINPGYSQKNNWMSLKTKIVGLQKACKDLEKAGPGGLLGVMTELDNNLTKADYLAGSVAGINLPPTLLKLTLKFNLFEKSFEEKIDPIRKGEQLMLNAGTARTVGIVTNIKKNLIDIDLKIPICSEKNDRVVISRKIAERWRLIGYSEIV
ncbi:translation initiation factor IF-2 subunit gamma [Candidatus Micrarchaeota archaeon RBG_16_36_9]|nr:MAG: translation initiation factor IF-2 subunit gamma [Candidatus Micrarchaeota archaeon RBG_16_36_9]